MLDILKKIYWTIFSTHQWFILYKQKDSKNWIQLKQPKNISRADSFIIYKDNKGIILLPVNTFITSSNQYLTIKLQVAEQLGIKTSQTINNTLNLNNSVKELQYANKYITELYPIDVLTKQSIIASNTSINKKQKQELIKTLKEEASTTYTIINSTNSSKPNPNYSYNDNGIIIHKIDKRYKLDNLLNELDNKLEELYTNDNKLSNTHNQLTSIISEYYSKGIEKHILINKLFNLLSNEQFYGSDKLLGIYKIANSYIDLIYQYAIRGLLPTDFSNDLGNHIYNLGETFIKKYPLININNYMIFMDKTFTDYYYESEDELYDDDINPEMLKKIINNMDSVFSKLNKFKTNETYISY